MSSEQDNNNNTSNNNNNNNNNTKIDPTTVFPSAAKERERWREEQLLNQFSRIIRTPMTISGICDHFHISRGTYYRWLKKAIKRDQKFMERNYNDMVLNEVNSTVDELKFIESHMNSILQDSKMEPSDRIEAGKLAGEAAGAVLRVYTEGPTSVWATMPLPTKEAVHDISSVVEESATIPELTDKKLDEVKDEIEREKESRRRQRSEQ
jgi:hypothetical protein